MVVLLLGLVVVLGAAVLVLVATGAAAALVDRLTGAGVAVLVAAAGGVAVLVLAGGLVVGTTPEGEHDGDGSGTTTARAPAPRPDEAGAPAAGPSDTPTARADADGLLRLHATRDDAPVAVPVLDRLRGGDVLRLRVDGLAPAARGSVAQCHRSGTAFARCTNAFPVQADEHGIAQFQYELAASVGCGVGGTCAVAVRDREGASAYAHLVFGEAAAAPARLSLEPAGPYRSGQRVTVTAEGLVPGADASIAFCDPGCRSPLTVRADDDGRAIAELALDARGRGRGCTVAVVGSGSRDAAVVVAFMPPPSPELDRGRVATGILVAAGLLLLAWFVARRTDWRPPSEASTPDLDATTL